MFPANSFTTDRRAFMKSALLGTGALGHAATQTSPSQAAPSALPAKSRVKLLAGTDRRALVSESMNAFERDISAGLAGKKLVLVKPNCVTATKLSVTDPDAVRGVLDFLKTVYDGPVIVGDSTASGEGTMAVLERTEYMPLMDEYRLKLVDLNMQPATTRWVLGKNQQPDPIRIISHFLDPEVYIISVARMKTHDNLLATLALKNIIMASPVNYTKNHPQYGKLTSEKLKMHQGPSQSAEIGYINYNMFHMASEIGPDFSIIDGVVGMEGNGPVAGTPVEHGVVLAGTDVFSVDRIGYDLMGISYEDVGYLQWCVNAQMGNGLRENITVEGPDPAGLVIPYAMHKNIKRQLGWKGAAPR